MKRFLVLVVSGALLATSASAYYHFLHYGSRTGPFTPVPEKFDLSALQNKTVYYLVSESGPAQMAAGDSFSAILSQMRLAAAAWDNVATSELRLRFGGLFSAGASQFTPAVEIIFDDVPPGLLALGGPLSRAEMIDGPGGAFVPITRSVLILRRDLSGRPSSSEGFFLTVVHELGHTLGLQHTLTSGVMSTEATRATSRARPLTTDDVAGISLLYPTRNFASLVGSISGRVTLSGDGVHLASVVALAPDGATVSALANPDGNYRIDGLPSGLYFLYAHPLPPSRQLELGPAEIVLPLDQDRRPIQAGGLFETQFYPGTKDLFEALPLEVKPGVTIEGVNFAVVGRGSSELHSVTTYSFPGSVPVKPAHLNTNSGSAVSIASGTGITSNNAPTPGLGISVVGGSARIPQESIRSYPPAPSFLEFDLHFNLFSGEGPRHLVFSLNEDIYILPSGMRLVERYPPSIESLTSGVDANGSRTVSIGGSNLYADTRIFFDGLPAAARSVAEGSGQIVVTPPPGASGHQAAVTAVNGDGQSSLFLQSPPFYTYDPAEPPSVTITPNALPAGVEAMVEIKGVNTNFTEGQTLVGFGSSDIVVRRIWVLSPTRLLGNVGVAAGATPAPALASIISGFEVTSQPSGFQIQPANPRAIVLNPQLLNPVTDRASVYPGGLAIVFVSNFTPGDNTGSVMLTLNGQPVAILSSAAGQITFQVPAGLSPGPAILRLEVGGESSLPIVVGIDPLPPVIMSVVVEPDTPVGANRPAYPGDILRLTIARLADPGADIAPARVRLTVGGLEHQVDRVYTSPEQPNLHQVRFVLAPAVPTGERVPLSVTIDGRTSLPYLLPINPL